MFLDINNFSMLAKPSNSLTFARTSEKSNDRRSIDEKSNNVWSTSEKQNDRRSIKGESNCGWSTTERRNFEVTNSELYDGISLPRQNMMIIINQVIRAWMIMLVKKKSIPNFNETTNQIVVSTQCTGCLCGKLMCKWLQIMWIVIVSFSLRNCGDSTLWIQILMSSFNHRYIIYG